ncbi:MAG: hypothetical protein GWP67_12900 [Gammaproteobacteria bacterium]|nr:hypothetical protein [Gammaproteobacteria bacterium]
MNFCRMPPYCTKNGTKTSDRMADNLIRVFSLALSQAPPEFDAEIARTLRQCVESQRAL